MSLMSRLLNSPSTNALRQTSTSPDNPSLWLSRATDGYSTLGQSSKIHYHVASSALHRPFLLHLGPVPPGRLLSCANLCQRESRRDMLLPSLESLIVTSTESLLSRGRSLVLDPRTASALLIILVLSFFFAVFVLVIGIKLPAAGAIGRSADQRRYFKHGQT